MFFFTVFSVAIIDFFLALVAFIHSEAVQGNQVRERRGDMQQRLAGWEVNLQPPQQDCSCLLKPLNYTAALVAVTYLGKSWPHVKCNAELGAKLTL